MSFQEEKRESIKRYMLEKIRQDDSEFIRKTMENFGISITTVKRYLRECLSDQIVCEDKDKKTGYQLKTSVHTFLYSPESMTDEDEIYYENILPLLEEISKEAKSIWTYVFTEMMNNALEHSGGEHIQCVVKRDYLYTEISIVDDGIGIYKNVQNYLQQKLGKTLSYQDVLTELYKGKLTTKPGNHSGEGVFFTSKVLNEFVIWSDSSIFVQGCHDRETFISSHLISYFNKLNRIGTMVVMKLENQTTRTIKEVFDMFAPIEQGFIKTRIPIAEVCPYAEPIARSQARRILYRLEEFKQIELDFAGVEFMGQGFADEIFRVFQNKHPEIELIPINANQTVFGMVKHVQRS